MEVWMDGWTNVSFFKLQMPPPTPSSSNSLTDRLSRLVLTAQFLWFIGHFTTSKEPLSLLLSLCDLKLEEDTAFKKNLSPSSIPPSSPHPSPSLPFTLVFPMVKTPCVGRRKNVRQGLLRHRAVLRHHHLQGARAAAAVTRLPPAYPHGREYPVPDPRPHLADFCATLGWVKSSREKER